MSRGAHVARNSKKGRDVTVGGPKKAACDHRSTKERHKKEGPDVEVATRPVRLALVALVALVVVGALAGSLRARRPQQREELGTVTLDENAWAGATANVYVVKYVLEKNLGCEVNIDEARRRAHRSSRRWRTARSTSCSRTGTTSSSRSTRSTSRAGKLIDLGSNGVIGHIGWFVPTYLMKQYPQLKTWQGLKGKESIFKSPESGSQGMFLGGDPSYVQKDAQLIKQLGLNLKFVVASAPSRRRLPAGAQAYKQKKPILFYWYTPQYLNTAYQLSRDQAPGAEQEVRRLVQPEAREQLDDLPVRVRADDHREGDHVEVRKVRLAGRRRDQALEVVGERPERRRQPDRRQAHGSGQGGRDSGSRPTPARSRPGSGK